MPRLLLDTHVVLWWLTAHPRLGSDARALIADSECHLSAASVWEVAIKFKLGKLPVGPDDVTAAALRGGILALPITQEHAKATAKLPMLHTDPFDRMLIAQAHREQLRLLTNDARLGLYGGDIHLL